MKIWKFKIDMVVEGSAFEPDRGREIARILRTLANRLESDETGEWLWDINGNQVGAYTLKQVRGV